MSRRDVEMLTDPYGSLEYAVGSGDDFWCFDFHVDESRKRVRLHAVINSETGSFIQDAETPDWYSVRGGDRRSGTAGLCGAGLVQPRRPLCAPHRPRLEPGPDVLRASGRARDCPQPGAAQSPAGAEERQDAGSWWGGGVVRPADTRQAAEHGRRAAFYLRQLDRAVAIAQAQGAPCLSERDLQQLAAQAWANAKLAAHYARAVGR